MMAFNSKKGAAMTSSALRRLAALCAAIAGLMAGLFACQSALPPAPSDPKAALVEKGRRIFFNETFNGNGRTCGTCHPVDNNFTLDPRFIGRLPKNDPLFVAEFVQTLSQNFENPRLMREFALIQENLDGFDDLANRFVMRGIPHTLGLRLSVASPGGPRTGWSGDGAPGDGSLRSFATGAVIQHFTKSLNRVAGVDFRLPTADELDALEAFQLSLGRQEELKLPLPLKGTVAVRGQAIFLDSKLGKCNFCHQNAGANANFGSGSLGNQNFDTGVEAMPDQPARLTQEKVPADDGFGNPGNKTFNTPSLIEAADTGPFFHNNSVATLEAAVGFYDGDSFNESPAGKAIAAATGGPIELDATQIQAVASFLRVLNALENIRQSIELLETTQKFGRGNEPGSALRQAVAETGDAIRVLSEVHLHPDAVAHLEQARRASRRALHGWFGQPEALAEAIAAHQRARAQLVR
jgi:mono/diheme cytochrome c family protein